METALDILICEDEAIVALEIERRIERYGHNVSGLAANAEAAIELAKKLKPDLALMDIKLQGEIPGTLAAKHLLERHGVPVIFITGYCDESTLEAAKMARPLDMLVKPVDDNQLRVAIEMGMYRYRYQRELLHSIRSLLKCSEHSALDIAQTLVKDFMQQESLESMVRVLKKPVAKLSSEIVNMTESLEKGLIKEGDDTALRHFAKQSLVSGLSACDLIKKMELLCGGGEYNIEECELSQNVGKIIQTDVVAREDIAVKCNFSRETLIISADKERLATVVRNLLANAAASMPHGGVINISSSIVFEELPERYNRAASPGWYAVLTIQDCGMGISDDQIERVLEPFYSGWDSVHSLGLGLSISNSVVRKLGGWIRINSKPLTGTNVSIFLPQLVPPVRTVDNEESKSNDHGVLTRLT